MEQPKKRNWWSRNWLWVVPGGGLIIVLGCCGFPMSIIMMVFGVIKSTDVYEQAVARAVADPAVIAVLGEPVEAGFWVGGAVNVSNSSGNADLMIPISGPNGSGMLLVAATRVSGEWHYDTLEVQVGAPSGPVQSIDLLSNPPPMPVQPL